MFKKTHLLKRVLFLFLYNVSCFQFLFHPFSSYSFAHPSRFPLLPTCVVFLALLLYPVSFNVLMLLATTLFRIVEFPSCAYKGRRETFLQNFKRENLFIVRMVESNISFSILKLCDLWTLVVFSRCNDVISNELTISVRMTSISF